MTEIIIHKKKYVLIREEDNALQVKAALKTTPVKKLSLPAGKKNAYKLIDESAKGK